jgi:hypothetical protein
LKREDLRGQTTMAENADRRLANRLQPLGHLTQMFWYTKHSHLHEILMEATGCQPGAFDAKCRQPQ